jgi:hypothetical protein
LAQLDGKSVDDIALAFGIEEMHAWLFVGLPVAIVFLAWIWNKLPRVLGIYE